MKVAALAMTIATGALFALPAQASEELAKKHLCLTCHTMDKKLVGPSYHDVATKYKADKGAEARLADKIRKGSVGTWGQIPMPPNDKVPEADAKTLAKWVLSTK